MECKKLKRTVFLIAPFKLARHYTAVKGVLELFFGDSLKCFWAIDRVEDYIKEDYIKEADIVILLTPCDVDSWIELGMALMANKSVVVIGKKETRSTTRRFTDPRIIFIEVPKGGSYSEALKNHLNSF